MHEFEICVNPTQYIIDQCGSTPPDNGTWTSADPCTLTCSDPFISTDLGISSTCECPSPPDHGSWADPVSDCTLSCTLPYILTVGNDSCYCGADPLYSSGWLENCIPDCDALYTVSVSGDTCECNEASLPEHGEYLDQATCEITCISPYIEDPEDTCTCGDLPTHGVSWDENCSLTCTSPWIADGSTCTCGSLPSNASAWGEESIDCIPSCNAPYTVDNQSCICETPWTGDEFSCTCGAIPANAGSWSEEITACTPECDVPYTAVDQTCLCQVPWLGDQNECSCGELPLYAYEWSEQISDCVPSCSGSAYVSGSLCVCDLLLPDPFGEWESDCVIGCQDPYVLQPDDSCECGDLPDHADQWGDSCELMCLEPWVVEGSLCTCGTAPSHSDGWTEEDTDCIPNCTLPYVSDEKDCVCPGSLPQNATWDENCEIECVSPSNLVDGSCICDDLPENAKEWIDEEACIFSCEVSYMVEDDLCVECTTLPENFTWVLDPEEECQRECTAPFISNEDQTVCDCGDGPTFGSWSNEPQSCTFICNDLPLNSKWINELECSFECLEGYLLSEDQLSCEKINFTVISKNDSGKSFYERNQMLLYAAIPVGGLMLFVIIFIVIRKIRIHRAKTSPVSRVVSPKRKTSEKHYPLEKKGNPK